MKLSVSHSTHTGFVKRNILLFVLFHAISSAVEKPIIVSVNNGVTDFLRPSGEGTNKVYQKDQRLSDHIHVTRNVAIITSSRDCPYA